VPNDDKTRGLIADLLAAIGAISTLTTEAETSSSLLPYRVAGAFARHPTLACRTLAQVLALVASREIPLNFLRAIATGRAHTINIGTHNFMDASRVANAPNDPVTQARLDACVFKGAIKNRATGEWEAVPMCAMNQSRWSELYAERLMEAGMAGRVRRADAG